MSARLLAVAPPAHQPALDALQSVLTSLREPRRTQLMFGPDFRAWLSAAEGALALLDRDASPEILFERVAAGPHLVRAMPRQRMDRGFSKRVRRIGNRLLADALARLPILLCFLTPPQRTFGPFRPDLSADGEEARARGELHLQFPAPATLGLRPGARLLLTGDGVGVSPPGAMRSFHPRELIEGTGIVLARRVSSTRRGLRPGTAGSAAARRLSAALALLADVWPAAHDEVLAHTRVVVPLSERNTVSFSLASRPGVSYINLRGKSLIDLADDLLHETAHHRLHSLEELAPLTNDDGEPRYLSPWRRSLRPVRGILHAAYTFTWRAGLLSALLRDTGAGSYPGRPASWIRRELTFELKALRKSLHDLGDADHRGLLTSRGGQVRQAIFRRVATLAKRHP